jgi:histidine triad (HIT) family protein
MENCGFCDIISGKLPSDFFHETPDVVVFSDIRPQTPQHLLIVPKKHITNINALTIADEPLISHMIATAKEVALKLGVAQKGYRLIFNVNDDGGQTVPHLHLHLLAGRRMHWPPG